MPSRRADAPSAAVVAAGGVGVLAVVAFVAALAFSRGVEEPDQRIAVARPDGGRLTVVVGRCRDERVASITLRSAEGVLWRIESAKGSIERVYEVGAEPLGFVTAAALRGEPAPPVSAEVTFVGDGRVRRLDVPDRGQLRPTLPELGDAAPPCAPTGRDWVRVVVFGLGGLAVVGGYVTMLVRWRRGHR